jgi:hypothetical protein
MTFAYSPAPVPALTETQLEELGLELRHELRRLSPGPTRIAGRLDVRAQTRMQLILDALERIRAGIYGTCLVCRSPVPYEHLEVLPETQTCVRCG